MSSYLTLHARRRHDGELELLGPGAPMIREELTRLERRIAELERSDVRITVEPIEPNGFLDLFNRADPSCERCDGIGLVSPTARPGVPLNGSAPCSCVRSADELDR